LPGQEKPMSRVSHHDFSGPLPAYDFGRLAVADPLGPCPAVEAELARARLRFEATFTHAPVGIAHVALDGGFLLVNPRFCAISGYDADTLIRTGFQQITHPDDLNADEALLARLTAGELPRYAMEKRYVRADGTIIWVKLTVAMARDALGAPEFYVAVIEDMSELRQASFEAMHDVLTGLLNRRGFAARARDRLAAPRPAQLIYLDLDGFKQLNDRDGHAAGDDCLADIGRLLTRIGREDGLIARVGGDEFLILLVGEDVTAAESLAHQVRGALADYGRGISASIGVASAGALMIDDLDRLIVRADDAMRAAKRGGKNRVHSVSLP
jgi:diguanylate cyclase (GGDEF)-like protein/PAS domain S-box-containing protein